MKDIGISIVVALIACLAARGLLWVFAPDMVIAWWAYVLGFCLCVVSGVERGKTNVHRP